MPERDRPRPGRDFEFKENERLFYRVSHKRFKELLSDEQTDVHRLELSHNSYGEFLFVTLSRAGETTVTRQPVTFYGLGYHEYRERWIHQEWYFYHANMHPSTIANVIPKDEAQEQIEMRVQEIAPYIGQAQQSRRAQLYEILADLTDEDGAISELEDLGPLLDDF